VSALRAPAPTDQESVGALVQRLGTDVTRIVRAEIALIQLRVSGALQAVRAAGVGLVAGVVLGLGGFGALTAGVVLVVAKLMPAWLAAFAVGAGLVLAAAVILTLDVRFLNREVTEALAPIDAKEEAHGG
jgi:hypothetical protein